MNLLTEKLSNVITEIKEFPIQNLSPSDDADKKTVYIYNFVDIIKRLKVWVKRIQDDEIEIILNKLDFIPENISELYEFHSEVSANIEYLEYLIEYKPFKIIEKKDIPANIAQEIKNHICNDMAIESANVLPYICEGYGLKEGTILEAFESKKTYISRRISVLSNDELLKLALKIKGKYSNTEFDELLEKIYDNDSLEITTSFESIRNMIVEEIRNAKFVIWIAVAWFTDIELARELFKKQNEGIDVQLIVNDDPINASLIEKVEKYLKIYKIPKNNSFDKLMHHKFCVFDLKKVVHGSYNWTIRAQFNNETATLITNRLSAESFAEEFIKLKKILIK